MNIKIEDNLKQVSLSDFIPASVAQSHELNIVFSSCTFQEDVYQTSLYESANVSRFQGFDRAVNKRQAEYLAGRVVAKSAMSGLGLIYQDIPIGDDRSPVWPNGVLGSITHTGSRALCCVSLASDTSYLGIDIENKMSLQTCGQVEKMLLTKNEKLIILNTFNDIESILTLVFSAKESLFKALYPIVKIYFDFLDVEIVSL